MSARTTLQLGLITTLAMVAFAANSLLCREALATGSIGAASFTLVRISSGAVMLAALMMVRQRSWNIHGNWFSTVALFGYAAAFSFAYISLSAATGALLLFGAVQITMIVYGLWSGERLRTRQIIGALTAGAGLVWLLLPGVHAPPLAGALLMIVSGIAWGVYSLIGRGTREPTLTTAGNFIRAVPLAALLFAFFFRTETITTAGLIYAAASGALASGLGYALWYAVLPALRATSAATVQLSVPILASIGGMLLLGEAVSTRFVLASIAVLGGIALFVSGKRRA